MQQSDKIKEYIKTVCEQIRWKKAHGPVSEEIEWHIHDQKNAFTNCGLDDETAIEKAIAEMGDPVIIGTEFDHTYRPKIEWSIVALTCIMILAGIFIRIILFYNVVESLEMSIFSDIVSIVIGFGCMTLSYFIDFTIIGKHPKKIFFGLTILLTVLIFTNDQTYFSFKLLLFPTAFAGIIYEMRNKSYIGIIQAGLIFLIPAVISISIWDITSILIYSCSCLILITMAVLSGWFNVKKSSALLLIYGLASLISIILIAIAIMSRPYIIGRIQAVFNPSIDPYSSGWKVNVVRSIISGAKLFGQGDLGEYEYAAEKLLPSIHTDYVLTYLIHKFGWIAFIIIMSFIITFAVRLFMLCRKQKSVLAKLVSVSVFITYTMQIIIYTNYNLGFQLFSPLTLPLVSYGGISAIINMFLIGIMLSVFNLGDLICDNNTAADMKYSKLFEFTNGKIIINLNPRA